MIRLLFGLFVAFLQSGLFAKGTFHKAHGTPYRTENSFRGIWSAARRGFKRIDLDLNMTKDGVIVNTHWARPLLKDAFRDMRGLIRNRNITVSQMTWAQVQGLKAPGGYRIRSLAQALEKCAQAKIDPKLEPKGDHRFENPAVWLPVKQQCDRLGLHVSAYTLRNLGPNPPHSAQRRKAAMEHAGIPCAIIR